MKKILLLTFLFSSPAFAARIQLTPPGGVSLSTSVINPLLYNATGTWTAQQFFSSATFTNIYSPGLFKTDVVISTQSSTFPSSLNKPHGTCQVGNKFYIGMRDSGSILVYNDPDGDLSDTTTLTIPGGHVGVESMIYDGGTDRIYFTITGPASAPVAARIGTLDPDDNSITVTSAFANWGGSPAITSDGTYIYVVTYTSPPAFRKITIASMVEASSATWTDRTNGHAIGMGTYIPSGEIDPVTRLFATTASNPAYYANVDPSDLSYTEIELSPIAVAMDDLMVYSDGNNAYSIIMGEQAQVGAVVDAATEFVNYFWAPLSYGIGSAGSYVFALGFGGHIVSYFIPTLISGADITGTWYATSEAPNEFFYSSGGKLFFTNWTTSTAGKLSQFTLPTANTVGDINDNLWISGTTNGHAFVANDSITLARESPLNFQGTDNYLYSPTAGTLKFYSGGFEVFHVDNGGMMRLTSSAAGDTLRLLPATGQVISSVGNILELGQTFNPVFQLIPTGAVSVEVYADAPKFDLYDDDFGHDSFRMEAEDSLFTLSNLTDTKNILSMNSDWSMTLGNDEPIIASGSLRVHLPNPIFDNGLIIRGDAIPGGTEVYIQQENPNSVGLGTIQNIFRIGGVNMGKISAEDNGNLFNFMASDAIGNYSSIGYLSLDGTNGFVGIGAGNASNKVLKFQHNTNPMFLTYSGATGLLTFEAVSTSGLQVNGQGEFRFGDSDSSNYISFRSSSVVASDVTFVLPDSDGSFGQALATTGSGDLYWTSASGGGSQIYPATATPSFPYGASMSTLTINGSAETVFLISSNTFPIFKVSGSTPVAAFFRDPQATVGLSIASSGTAQNVSFTRTTSVRQTNSVNLNGAETLSWTGAGASTPRFSNLSMSDSRGLTSGTDTIEVFRSGLTRGSTFVSSATTHTGRVLTFPIVDSGKYSLTSGAAQTVNMEAIALGQAGSVIGPTVDTNGGTVTYNVSMFKNSQGYGPTVNSGKLIFNHRTFDDSGNTLDNNPPGYETFGVTLYSKLSGGATTLFLFNDTSNDSKIVYDDGKVYWGTGNETIGSASTGPGDAYIRYNGTDNLFEFKADNVTTAGKIAFLSSMTATGSLNIAVSSTSAVFVSSGAAANGFIVDSTNGTVGIGTLAAAGSRLRLGDTGTSITSLLSWSDIVASRVLRTDTSFSTTHSWTGAATGGLSAIRLGSWLLSDNRTLNSGTSDLMTGLRLNATKTSAFSSTGTVASVTTLGFDFVATEGGKYGSTGSVSSGTIEAVRISGTFSPISDVPSGSTFYYRGYGTKVLFQTVNPTVTNAGKMELRYAAFADETRGASTGTSIGSSFYSKITGWNTNWAFNNDSTATAHVYLGGDNNKTYWGTGSKALGQHDSNIGEASISWQDSTGLTIKPNEVTAGSSVTVQGLLLATAAVTVGGATNATQLTLNGNSSQTFPFQRFLKSDGTEYAVLASTRAGNTNNEGIYTFWDRGLAPTADGSPDDYTEYGTLFSGHVDDDNIYMWKMYNESYSTTVPALTYFAFNDGTFNMATEGAEAMEFATNGFANVRLKLQADGTVSVGGAADSADALNVNGNTNSSSYSVGGTAGFTGSGAYTNFVITNGIITNAF